MNMKLREFPVDYHGGSQRKQKRLLRQSRGLGENQIRQYEMMMQENSPNTQKVPEMMRRKNR